MQSYGTHEPYWPDGLLCRTHMAHVLSDRSTPDASHFIQSERPHTMAVAVSVSTAPPWFGATQMAYPKSCPETASSASAPAWLAILLFLVLKLKCKMAVSGYF